MATSASQATVDHSIDPRWGNSQGLTVLEKMDQLSSDVKILKDQSKSTINQIAELNTEIANLNTKVNILTPESSSYLAVRNRFFARYRRDILGSTINQDREAVPLGNQKAHGGDVIADGRLYENGTRFDDEIFQELYGLQWARVCKIGKISAIQKIMAI